MALFDKRARRKATNALFIGFCTFAAALALIALAAILISLLINGAGGVNLDVFTKDTPAPGSPGGLRNAIVGSLMLCALGMVIAVVVGILAGTWLAEYAGRNRWTQAYGSVVRFVNDVLLSAPSILVGLFIYYLLVAHTIGHFSGWAGAIALALLAVPVEPDWVRYGDFQISGGRDHAKEFFASDHRPTAIFAGSDLQALGVLEAATRADLRVPQDVSVVGYDDLPLAQWFRPRLTTVHQPLRAMAAQATRMVLELAAGGQVGQQRIDLSTDLVVRETTAPPP